MCFIKNYEEKNSEHDLFKFSRKYVVGQQLVFVT